MPHPAFATCGAFQQIQQLTLGGGFRDGYVSLNATRYGTRDPRRIHLTHVSRAELMRRRQHYGIWQATRGVPESSHQHIRATGCDQLRVGRSEPVDKPHRKLPAIRRDTQELHVCVLARKAGQQRHFPDARRTLAAPEVQHHCSIRELRQLHEPRSIEQRQLQAHGRRRSPRCTAASPEQAGQQGKSTEQVPQPARSPIRQNVIFRPSEYERPMFGPQMCVTSRLPSTSSHR